jgi:hypothetical protein
MMKFGRRRAGNTDPPELAKPVGMDAVNSVMLNRADECRQRADECRQNAAQVADDALRGTYLDLARRWRMLAHQAESLEQKKERQKKQADWLKTAKTNLLAIVR